VKPLDSELDTGSRAFARRDRTAEDHYRMGGFGSAVMELLEENQLNEVG